MSLGGKFWPIGNVQLAKFLNADCIPGKRSSSKGAADFLKVFQTPQKSDWNARNECRLLVGTNGEVAKTTAQNHRYNQRTLLIRQY